MGRRTHFILTPHWTCWEGFYQNYLHSLCWLLVPFRWNGGDYRFPCRLSVFLSVRLSICLSTRFSGLFSVVLLDNDLKFGMWICLYIIQIKFDFHYVWPTFTWVTKKCIALCKKLVFLTFFFRLLWYWLEIWYMNLSWHKTDQDWLLSRLTHFYMSYCPLLNIVFRTFLCHLSRYWLEISYINLTTQDIDLKFHI